MSLSNFRQRCLFVVLACAFLGSCASSDSSLPQGANARVVKVIDGDTIDVSIDGKVERVRLIGIDTPETNVYDYIITLDNTAIQRVVTGEFNRNEIAPANMPVARGDLGYYGYQAVAFPQGYDYTMIVDTGYKAIPADVEIIAVP